MESIEKQILDLRNIRNATNVTGVVYIQEHGKKLDMTTNVPLKGTLSYKGKTVSFQVWKSSVDLIALFNENDLSGRSVYINGIVGEYKNELNITLSSVRADIPQVPIQHFLKSVDVEGVFAQFVTFIQGNLTHAHQSLLQEFFQAENLWDKFKYTWAGAKMHDTQVGGLMNHTLKMLKLLKVLTESDHRLEKYASLLYLSTILHDIGKVYEIDTTGRYTKYSFIGHRTIGIEMVARNKTMFLKHMTEMDYYQVLAVIQGHHGEYGDAPVTVWALMIHYIDMVDSQLTGVLDKIENTTIGSLNGVKTVYAGGKHLPFEE